MNLHLPVFPSSRVPVQSLLGMTWRTAPFDPRFFEKSPLFWPIARAARAFEGERDWPAVETYGRAFERDVGVRFVLAAPRPRRKRALEMGELYDARIVGGVVPTRARSWHDFMNALVWAAFPRAKAALHARQHRAIAARVAPGAERLPGARTRELDALAMLDEGGVVVLRDGQSERALVFGHAIYEGLAAGGPPVYGASVTFDVSALPADDASCVSLADASLAGALADGARFVDPSSLVRWHPGQK
jgi:hypothetical protein